MSISLAPIQGNGHHKDMSKRNNVKREARYGVNLLAIGGTEWFGWAEYAGTRMVTLGSASKEKALQDLAVGAERLGWTLAKREEKELSI